MKSIRSKKGRFFRKLLRVVLFLVVVMAVYLAIDYSGPRKIRLKQDHLFGFNCMRANDLLVQEFDHNGDLWASRGMLVYRLPEGGTEFIKEGHVPTGPSFYWLRNFTLVRRLSLRPECIELVVTDKGDICALSAGILYLRPTGEREFRRTMEIDHYGSEGQGVRNDGILSIGDSTVYFGEYFQNEESGEVNILRSTGDLNSWHSAYRFSPGEVRHVHSIQQDPYSGKLWFCTGDANPASFIAWTDDNFKTIHRIGSGSQMWRVCQLVFTEDAVYWGTDTSVGEKTGIFRWNRESEEVEKLEDPAGAVFYGTRLKGGTVVLSTNRQGYENEIDKKTRLFLIDEDDCVTPVECGTWNEKKQGFWFKFAKLRFQRHQGSSSLVISCLNQKEVTDGDLIIIQESELVNAMKPCDAP